jgi:hypothetical protein
MTSFSNADWRYDSLPGGRSCALDRRPGPAIDESTIARRKVPPGIQL